MEQQPPTEDKKVPPKLTFQSVKDYCTKTRQLLKEQEQYQIELFNELTKNKTIAQIEASGYGLSNMLITSTKRGYYGKTVLSLTKAYHSEKNPYILPQECKIQVGDDVAIFKNNSVIADGVVSKRIGPKLQISTRKQLEDDNDLEGVNCHIILKWNEVTFNRQFKVLQELQKSQSSLIPQFFPPAVSTFAASNLSVKNLVPNPKLNEEQNEAVERCMKERVFLLHGPPGTGKTTTVCQVIIEAVKRGYKVLACGPSNISVDNIVQGLFGRVNCLRIGNPARIIDNVIQRCLDYQIAKSSNSWKNQVKKLQALRKKISRGGTKDERKAMYAEIKQLKDQIYRLQEQVIEQILQEASVLCCTNIGAADRVFRRYLPKQIFDLVVIDECGQALEVSCWIPLLKGRRVLLAGDHKQLPPTIQGNQNSLLSHTLFTRAMEQLIHIPSTMLKVQYRMNNSIMGWSNQQFYNGKLRAHNSVQNHTLRQLCTGVKPEEESLLFIDTGGCGMGQEGAENESKMNVGEADLVISIYTKLIGYGVQSKYIAILTPYSKQVALIKSLVGERGLPLVDVSTVDGIQGRQKQCIIISMVRSNSKRDIGFLKDWRRMNVAVTRARRMLILIGNIECVSADKYIKALVNWVQQHGHISTAQQFRGEQNIRFGLGASDKIDYHEKTQKSKQSSDKPDNSKQKKKKQNKDDLQGKDEGEEIKKKKKDRKEKLEETNEYLKNHKEHTIEEQATIKEHFKKVFEQMAKEITINHATPFERKMIHQIAEEMGLCHETAPDKKFIKVWKKMTDNQVSEHFAELERQKFEQDLKEERKKLKKMLKKQKKAAQPPTNKNSNKYSSHMQALADNLQQSDESQKQEIKPELQKKQEQTEPQVEEDKTTKKRKKNKNKKEEKAKEEQDIEQLMRQYNADKPKEDQCFKCTKKLSTVTAVPCKFCGINFCRPHVLAQEHGCGEIAKQEARRQKPTDRQLQQAAKKLQQKIKEQEQARKRKTKDNKK